MKKLVIGALILAVVVLLWLQIRRAARLPLSFLVGETVTLVRGTLTIPIEASGTIEPKDRIEIKSEASGTVSETPYEVGQMVRSGDILVKLDPQDEQRLVDKAVRTVEQSRIDRERTKATLEQRGHEVSAVQGRIKANDGDLNYWTWKYDFFKKIETGTNQDEIRLYETNKLKAEALKQQLEAQLEQARLAVKLGEEDVNLADLALQQATTNLADARQRLNETTIVAPMDCMLTRLLAKKGQVIASASASFTGGTPLAYVADVTELYVKTLVDEADIGRVYEIAPPSARPGRDPAAAAPAQSEPAMPITPGTPVDVSVEAFPEETFKGSIDLIEPEPSQGVGDVVVNYVVWIRLDPTESGKLQLGMQATVKFVSETVENAVLVPNEAVQIVANQRGIYVPVESQKNPGSRVPKFVTFRAGLDDGMNTQVLDGLQEGQEVYIKLPMSAQGEQVTGDE
jgi:HlyD family secretion protein